VHERAIAIGNALTPSTTATYSSALISYLDFCKNHQLPISPTVNTLSFFSVYTSHFIEPRSVDNYLSGICSELEPYFPDIRAMRRHPTITKTLRGCKRLRSSGVQRKTELTTEQVELAITATLSNASYDDLLFLTQLTTGFKALMRLSELVLPDALSLRDYRKISPRASITLTADNFQFFLPSHKADATFEGNHILIVRSTAPHDAHHLFTRYLRLQDLMHPYHPHLWILRNGEIPTRSWFLNRLSSFFPSNIAGQSMRSRGATALALAGVPPYLIKATGRCASDTFEIYVRKHPSLLTALILTQSA
jgi:hypothetical protein